MKNCLGFSYLCSFFFNLTNKFKKGDISLDDISVTDGYCESNEFFKCDFESGLCGFTFDTTAEYNWTRQAGKKYLYAPTGPFVDHTVT